MTIESVPTRPAAHAGFARLRPRDRMLAVLEGAAALLAFAGVLYVLFGPVLAEELNWGGRLVLAWFAVLGAGMAMAAVVVALRGASGATRYAVNALTVLVTTFALFLLLTVGWVFLPAALLAALASLATARK